MYGPVSDLVPSTPVFEMYPLGFVSLSDYLQRRGISVRIINLAVKMLKDPGFDVERFIKSLDACAFGIDLHWLVHAHGSLEIAKIVKKYHPHTPVIFGGFSATYFHKELIQYPFVDFIVKGDSTEEPMYELIKCIKGKGDPASIPNIVWKTSQGSIDENSIEYVPSDINYITLNYKNIMKSVVKYGDLIAIFHLKIGGDTPSHQH